jgi:hypothetical protein
MTAMIARGWWSYIEFGDKSWPLDELRFLSYIWTENMLCEVCICMESDTIFFFCGIFVYALACAILKYLINESFSAGESNLTARFGP